MIFPWHTDLFQPGRAVCVVFRASPLIWPTPYLAHTTRPGPSAFWHQGAPPVVFHAGLWVLGGNNKGLSSWTASAESQTLCRKVLGGPRSPFHFGGDCLFVMCKYGWAG